MRRGARIDAAQPDIVSALRKAGAHVLLMQQMGGGCPDLAALYRGVTYWLEVKSDLAAVTRKGATADRQRMFRKQAAEHGVAVHIVKSAEEALSVIGALGER